MSEPKQPTVAPVLYGVAALGPALAIIAPLSMAPLLAVAVVAAVAIRISGYRRLPAVWPVPLAIFAGAVAWGAVSLFWTTSFDHGIVAVGRIGFMLLGGLVLAALAGGLAPGEKRRLGTVLCAGMCVGIALLALNVFADGAATDTLRVVLPMKAYAEVKMNRPATIIAVFLWPMLMAMQGFAGRKVQAATIFVTFATVAWTDSATAAVAVAAGIGVLLAVTAGMRVSAVRRAVAAALVAVSLAGPLYVIGPPVVTHQLVAPILPNSFFHRVYIWAFVAGKIAEKPLFGWGLSSSRNIPGGNVDHFIPMKSKDGTLTVNVEKMPLLPLHPHNGALQVWLELGLPGILMLCGLILYLSRQIDTRIASKTLATLCVAQMFCTFLTAESAYGLWQSWWLSTIMLGVVLAVAILPGSRAAPREQAGTGSGGETPA